MSIYELHRRGARHKKNNDIAGLMMPSRAIRNFISPTCDYKFNMDDGWMKEWMKCICPCFTPSWIALEKQYLFHGLRFQLFFFCLEPQETDFYIERVTAHRIKINDHSCFHNRLPNSKTKLKLKHLWEQGGPLVFRGPYAACVFYAYIGRIVSGYSKKTVMADCCLTQGCVYANRAANVTNGRDFFSYGDV